MRASVIVRGRVVFALVLCAAGAGCADEKDPAYLASLLEDPVETENALEKLRKLLDERLQVQDPKAQASSVGDFGSRATDGLAAAFKRAEGNPLVQTRIISVLTRTIAYTKNPGQRKKVLSDVFFPVLDRFKEKGEDPAQASLVVDTIAGLMKPPMGDKPLLDPSEIEAAVTKFRDVTQSVRAGLGCKERYVRMQGRESPVADQEQLLLSCIGGTAALLGHETGVGAQNAGVSVLLDALRESFFFQDFYLNRAAADAIDDVAPFLGPDFVRQVAPALVEGLFLQGDFFLYPYARRALVHLAALSPGNRDIVVDELLRALNVDMDEDVAKALPAIEGLGKNDRLDLLRLPCGTTLSVSCSEKEASLREYRDKGWPPGKAACNRGADPDRPGSGFQWGFNYEVVWDKVGNILVDIVAPYKPGTSPDASSKVGLAVSALQTEVRLLDAWATKVQEAKKLHDAISALYPDLMSARAASAEAGAEQEAAASTGRGPTVSREMEAQFKRLNELRASDGTKYGAEARQLALDAVAALSLPEAKSSDKEAFLAPLTGVFRDAQNELLALADFDNEYAAVNLRLWRSLSAARTLSLLGVTGRDDETLRQVLRVTQFALDNLMGFRVTPLKAFPLMVLRFRQRFTAEGMPMMPQPTIPAFMDAIQNFQRPTPQVMNFLLHMMAASALTGENQNATTRPEKYFMLNADVTTFRALAARSFFAVFRHGDVLPDADRYLDLFNFYTGDVQGVLALEKTSDSDPAFQLYPPIVRGPSGAILEPDESSAGDWLATLPERSPLFTFDSYKDALARCVLFDRESRSDAAKWRREMNDEQKSAYCKKWVEPWASRYLSEMRGQEIAKLNIDDSRCWTHMKNDHEARFQFCIDLEAGRTPTKALDLSKEECKKVREYDDDYLYCVDLRFLPEYVESGKPTLWGCYDEFPWLRGREAIGPVCEHIAGRTLAAYLYVKFRSDARIPAADGVAFDKLNGIMTLDELMRFTKIFGQEQNVDLFRKLDLLVQELAKVQAEFPVFRRPRSDADRKAKTSVRKPEDVEAPTYIPSPWFWHDDWVERQPRSFADLRASFLESCRPEDDETSPECAKDGGKLGNQMKITIEGGQPGPLMQEAAGLAIMLMRQDLVGVAEMRDALNTIESKCWSGSAYAMGCLREGALEGDGREKTVFVNSTCRGMVAEALGCLEDPANPEFCKEKRDAFTASLCARHFSELTQARGVTSMELNRRVRSLYLLSALADLDRGIAEATVGDLLIAVDSDPRFLPPVTFGLQKIRPTCCPPGQAGACAQVGCERVRLFARYWNTQPIRDTQVPDIDALYYMLLASR